jgi:dTMP kinase
MISRGNLISLEGSEGCGKSTQIARLADHLRSQGHHVLTVREPGGTPLGEAIRHLLKHDATGHGMTPESELLLFAASRAELVRKSILPALEAGTWVLCDRFFDSTTVYQGMARGLPMPSVLAINAFAVDTCVPDLTLVLDLPVAESLSRMQRRPGSGPAHDRMESEPNSFYEAVRQGYLSLAAREPARVRVVSASDSPDLVFQRILQEIDHAFPRIPA